MAEFFSNDFRFVSQIRDIDKQEALDWGAANGNEMTMGNLEMLYENDEVATVSQSAGSTVGGGVVIPLHTKKDGKTSQCRVVR